MSKKRRDDVERKKILIVEDDPDMMEIYRDILGVRYDIAAAASAEEARERRETGTFDLVILDIIMPKETGNVLFDELLREDGGRPQKILVASVVHDFRTVVERAKRDTPTRFIGKPFRKDTLLRVVADMVGRTI
jgi:DNA-binding NtrC family response regulator